MTGVLSLMNSLHDVARNLRGDGGDVAVHLCVVGGDAAGEDVPRDCEQDEDDDESSFYEGIQILEPIAPRVKESSCGIVRRGSAERLRRRGCGVWRESDVELMVRFTFYFVDVIRVHGFDFAGGASERCARQVELIQRADLIVAGASQSVLRGDDFDVGGDAGGEAALRLRYFFLGQLKA